MELTLEHVVDSRFPNTFRLAFHSAHERVLLPYPCVTCLRFSDDAGQLVSEWKTRLLVSDPLDDFVLNPDARIAFDLVANVNESNPAQRWGIALPQGLYHVQFVYHVVQDADWYDYLAKRSRMAALTTIWRGTAKSNTIRFNVQPPMLILDALREENELVEPPVSYRGLAPHKITPETGVPSGWTESAIGACIQIGSSTIADR